MKVCGFVLLNLLLFASVGIAARQQDPPKGNETASVYAELGKAPEKYRAKRNPLEKDQEAAMAGKILFEEHCEECHGKEALGGKKAPSLRVAEVQDAPPGTIFWILSNGVVRRGMPVWSRLPEPQRWQLVSYLKSLGKSSPDPSPSKP
jgi:mono/diheme cytochrome c family protein